MLIPFLENYDHRMTKTAYLLVLFAAWRPIDYCKAIVEEDDGETLKDAADFPVGNVWSSGHPTWGNTKCTDLGGPGDDFSPTAWGKLSTVRRKNLQLPLEDELLAAQFNSLTPEVALKPHCISIAPDTIDFSEADAMMDFAEANGFRVHGHVLLFNNSVPVWALEYRANDVWTRAEWESWLENYISTVVGRYRGRIASWDVANEVTPLGGGKGISTDNFWYQVIGPDYLQKAFRWTDAADPDAKLFINEVLIDFLPSKRKNLIDIADDLRKKGARVDGIGFQGHLPFPTIMASYATNKKAYQRAADAGYLVHLSELDIAVNVFGLTSKQTMLQNLIQRKSYNDIARAYIEGVPKEQRWGITIWNVADRNSFYNTLQIWFKTKLIPGNMDFPMLWNNDYETKPAYYGFRNGLKNKKESLLLGKDKRHTKFLVGNQTDEIYLNSDEAMEMEQMLLGSRQVLVHDFGLTEEEVDELIEEARSSLQAEGINW